MKVQVRLLGFYQMILGKMYEEVTLQEGATLETLWTHFQEKHPQLRREDMKWIAGMSVNGTYIHREQWETRYLSDDDKVDLISQMAGG